MLGDVRVLDLSTEFGLMCGHLLAEMGADVQQWVLPADADRSRASRHRQAYTLGKQVTVVDWRQDPERLRGVAGFADLLARSRTLDERRALEDEIDQRLAAWTRGQDGSALETLLQGQGIPAHRVLTTHDLASDPQLEHREHLLPVRHPQFAPAAVESSRLRFSRTQAIRPVAAAGVLR